MKNILKVALLAAAAVNSGQAVEFKANVVKAKDKTVVAAKNAGSFIKDKSVATGSHIASHKVAYGSAALAGLTGLAAFADYKLSGSKNAKEWATSQTKDLLLVKRTGMKAKVIGWTLRTLVAANVLFGSYKGWTGLNMTNRCKNGFSWTKSKFTSSNQTQVEETTPVVETQVEEVAPVIETQDEVETQVEEDSI